MKLRFEINANVQCTFSMVCHGIVYNLIVLVIHLILWRCVSFGIVTVTEH